MGLVVAFLVVYVVAALVSTIAIARLARRFFPRLRLFPLVIGLSLVALALTPVPTRHGLLFLLPELVSEGSRELSRARAARQDRQREARLESRFAGYLPEEHLPGRWRDPATGLVWTGQVASVPDISRGSLRQGQALCADLVPRGYWAVPRNAEFYLLARAGRLDGRWLAEVFLAPEGISVPGLQQRGQARQHSAAGVPLRCVAVTPPAPRSGYSSSDIPLDDWNRYQLGLPPASR